jgi:hypothetical protein
MIGASRFMQHKQGYAVPRVAQPTEPATPPYQAPGGGVAGVRQAAGEAAAQAARAWLTTIVAHLVDSAARFASMALDHDVSSSQL